MIAVQLAGGMGNQMFQYSVGRALAEKNRTRLKLDISALSEYPSRSFALHHFCIDADVLTNSELQRLGISNAPSDLFRRVLKRLFGRPSIPVIAERSFEFDPQILSAPAPSYLKGYWQCPKYFASVDSLIRRE